jgi:RNA polymerase sigma factor (sigma-70 family)
MDASTPNQDQCVGPTEVADLYRCLSKPLEEIVRLGVLRVPDPTVEDACQFAWGRLLVHRGRVHRDTALPWLARTAVREALKLLGRECRYLPLETADAWRAALAADCAQPHEQLERRERLEALRKLPERQQRMIWLHALGLNYSEIALHTGYSARTVERQLLRGKRALREAAA